MFVWPWISLVVADLWNHWSIETEWNVHYFLVATVVAVKHCLSGSNIRLTSRSDNTWNANQLSHKITLEISKHERVLIRMNLYLKVGRWLHVWVHLIVVVDSIDCLDCRLEDFDIFKWTVPEDGDKLIVEGNEVLHFDFQVMITSLGIVFKLFSIDIDTSNLGLPDKVHKLVLGIEESVFVVLTASWVMIDEILVRAVDLITV